MVGIGYVRIAAMPQEAPRAGLDAQIAKILRRAKAEGIDLISVIEDSGESAHNLKRPGLTQLLRFLDTGSINVVIVADLSRLARDILDH
jgi:DNA invertase Pin-like site-specific DNA recombinase